MLAWIVGNVDVPAAAVLIGLGGGITIIITAFIAKYQSKDDAERDFELKKLQLAEESRRALYQYETDRGYKMKQLEQNLITSHRATD